MRIALCIFRYFPYGGLQKDFLRIAEECAAHGHEVVCFCGNESEGIPVGGSPRIEWRELDLSGVTNHARAESFERRMEKILAREHFDCTLGFNRMAGLDFYFAGDSCLADSLSVKKNAWLLRRLPRYRAFLRLEAAVFGAASATRILALVEAQKKAYQRCYGTPDERFFILPAGYDSRCGNVKAPCAARACLRRKLGVGDDEFAVMLIGSDFKRKGASRAVRALAALPDASRARTKLFLVGDSPSEKYLKLSESCGIADRVFALGGRRDVPALMCAADLLVHPAREEAGGSVLLEAASSGLPVICTDVCGFSSQISAWEGGTVLASPYRQEELDAALAHAAARFFGEGRAAACGALDLRGWHRAKVVVELLEKAFPQGGSN